MDKHSSWFLIKARQAWWVVTDVLILVWFCRAPVFTVALGGTLIASTDQARDIVIAVGSDKESFWQIPFVLTLWAFTGWYWARITLEFAQGIALERCLPRDHKVFLGPWAVAVRKWAANHLPRIIGAAAYISVAIAFWRAHNIYTLYGDTTVAGPYFWSAVAYLTAAVVFYVFVWWRKRIIKWAARRMGWASADDAAGPGGQRPLRAFTALNPFAQTLLALSIAASPVFFVLFAVWPVKTAAAIGSAISVVLLGLSLAVALPSLLVIMGMRSGLPVLGSACLVFFLSPWLAGDHHDARSCRSDPSKACVDKDFEDRKFLKPVFFDWYQKNIALSAPMAGKDGTPVHAPPLIVVATAGGASRAAFFTTQVLGEIARREDNFADRLFMISGVSGGSLGAAVFRSLVEVDRRATGGTGSPLLLNAPQDGAAFIDHDFLAPSLGTGLYVDLPFSAITFTRKLWTPIDRAAALEKAWEAAWLSSGIVQKGRNFTWEDGLVRTFTKDSDRPWPILALNGTSVEKGKRIITSNVLFTLAGKNKDGERALGGEAELSGGINRYDALEILQSDIPISTAVTMSARFPIVSPAGALRNARNEMVSRVIDGGLFENFGAVLADEVLRYLVDRLEEAYWGKNLVAPVAILISSDPSLDRLHLRPRTGRRDAVPDCSPESTKLIDHPGNGWPECPGATTEYATLAADPLTALYDGRVARGELAATALRDRIAELRTTVRDRLLDKTTSRDAVNARMQTDSQIDFFHFRQCRVAENKSPTMSWHDSSTAWKSMRKMLALEEGDEDWCGNRAEFFRLCRRLERLTGRNLTPGDTERACLAKGWPRPI